MFGQRLAELRAAAKMSREDLAQKTGFSYEAIRLLELGRRQPGLAVLCKLKSALGCTMDDLVPDSVCAEIAPQEPVGAPA